MRAAAQRASFLVILGLVAVVAGLAVLVVVALMVVAVLAQRPRCPLVLTIHVCVVLV